MTLEEEKASYHLVFTFIIMIFLYLYKNVRIFDNF